MRVSEGTSFELSDGTWLKPEVEMDDSDLERALAEWQATPEQIAALTLQTRYHILSALARLMLIDRQLTAKKVDERWVNEDGKPMREMIIEELKGLFSKVKGIS